MKIRDKFKKLVTVTLASAMVILSANTLSVHAQSISDVSIGKPGYGIVTTQTGSTVNVRNAPNLDSSSVIVSVPSDSRLMIVGETGDFYIVQYDKYQNYGYVYKTYLDFRATPYYLVANTNSSPLNMRASVSTSAESLAKIPKGTAFAYVFIAGDWYVGVYGNIQGYTAKEYTQRCNY